jgi:hypothetical protein
MPFAHAPILSGETDERKRFAESEMKLEASFAVQAGWGRLRKLPMR